MPPALPLPLPSLQTARRALLLSGTPALSRPAELYTQMAAVDTSLNISFVDFGIRYCDGKRVGGAGRGGAGYVPQQLLPLPQNPWGWDFSGASHLEELQLYLQQRVMIRYASTPPHTPPPPHTLPTPLPLPTPSSHPPHPHPYLSHCPPLPHRRLKQEVLEQLPDKHRQMVAIEHLIPKGRELRQMQTQLNHASTLKVGGSVGGAGTPSGVTVWKCPSPPLSNWSSVALCCHCTSGQPISSSRPSSMSE